MAHSRLEKIGTIYTRITGLIRSGALKLEERPLWYDIYQAFPPTLEPRYDRPAPTEPIKQIFYPEDVIRAKCHKHFRGSVGAVNLSDGSRPTLTQRVIGETRELCAGGSLSVDEAFSRALEQVRPVPKDPKSDQTLSATFTEASKTKLEEKISLKEIFKE